MSELLCGDNIDKRLNWPLGKADWLARKGKLPHIILPDSAIRFRWEDISALLQSVPAQTAANTRGTTNG